MPLTKELFDALCEFNMDPSIIISDSQKVKALQLFNKGFLNNRPIYWVLQHAADFAIAEAMNQFQYNFSEHMPATERQATTSLIYTYAQSKLDDFITALSNIATNDNRLNYAVVLENEYNNFKGNSRLEEKLESALKKAAGINKIAADDATSVGSQPTVAAAVRYHDRCIIS